MLKFLSRNILTGLVTILPVALTLYLIYWMVASTESILGGMIQAVIPKVLYFPGIGVIASLGIALIVGLMMRAYVVQQIFSVGEQFLYRMPLVKSVYKAIRDFFEFFSPTTKKEFEQVVSVSLGNSGIQLIGFVTQAIPEKLPEGFREKDSILVYLPLSYMIGGYAVLVPRSSVRPLNMNMEEAMRFTLTAGVTGSIAPNRGRKRKK